MMDNKILQNVFIDDLKMEKQCSESQNSSSIGIIGGDIVSSNISLSLIDEKQYVPHNLFNIKKPTLKYKKCKEYTQYSNCVVTYLDHPSAIFIQIPEDGSTFQKMHEDMNRYYSKNQTTAIFELGDFCVAYSTRYSEFYRARIIQINHIDEQCLLIFVDFGNSEWINNKNICPIQPEFTELKIQSIAVTLSNIIPKKDSKTGFAHWSTNIGKQCTRKLRRLLIKSDNEPFLFVSVTFLSNQNWWPLPLVDIKLDDQDIAEILHTDGFARLTRNNQELKMIYSDFGAHPDEYFIFGIQEPNNMTFEISE